MFKGSQAAEHRLANWFLSFEREHRIPRPVGRNADSGPPYALYRRQLCPEGSSRSRNIYDKRLRPEAAYRKAIVSVDKVEGSRRSLSSGLNTQRTLP